MKLSFGDEWYMRNFDDSDIPALVKYANNRNVWINLTDQFPHPYTEASAQEWIQHVRIQKIETNFAIATEEELIGGIGFEQLKGIHCKSATLGYWLGEPYWRKGIVTGAVRAMTEYIFTRHDIARIGAGVFSTNLASVRVLEKAGYTYEARLRKHVFKDGKILDLMIYAILRDEWQTGRIDKNIRRS